jgi:Fe-S oxidoreductase
LCNHCIYLCGAFDLETGDPIVNIPDIVVAMRADVVENGIVPSIVKEFLENVSRHSNPYGKPRAKRGEWAEGIEIKSYDGEEFLYYVGCVGSYDTEAQEMARNFGRLLLKAGVSFGVLGSKEGCDGNEVNRLGERGLFQVLAEENIELFKDLGVKKIVTLSPHAYNTMRNEYPEFGGEFDVMHYTQLLRNLIKEGRIRFSKEVNAKVTYHDPCFLGRYNSEYEAPREILKAIPGIELVEMERNKEDSFCCGGGGGNFYTDLLHGGDNTPARIRVREAYETGAEILAVACPICLTMFKDALKVEGLEKKMKVKDIAGLVCEAI